MNELPLNKWDGVVFDSGFCGLYIPTDCADENGILILSYGAYYYMPVSEINLPQTIALMH